MLVIALVQGLKNLLERASDSQSVSALIQKFEDLLV
jgi:hypothetical protein